jgi:putative phosphoribosyl transferase
MRYPNRRAAGRVLAAHLANYRAARPIVLALPRGGVPVAFEVAQALRAPLDVLVVRKVGMPGHEEFGLGALVLNSEPHLVLDEELLAQLKLTRGDLEAVINRETLEALRRRALYRDNRPAPQLQGRTIVVVDDGLATGGTARSALRAIRAERPNWLVLAVPAGAPDSLDRLAGECDSIVCPLRPAHFAAVGAWYDDFSPTEDDEVLELLNRSREWMTKA